MLNPHFSNMSSGRTLIIRPASQRWWVSPASLANPCFDEMKAPGAPPPPHDLNELMPHVIQCQAYADVLTQPRCTNKASLGYLCPAHARSIRGLEVKESTIAGAMRGLFTTRSFEAGEVIDYYLGKRYTDEEWFPDMDSSYEGRYAIQIDDLTVLPRFSTDCFSMYANDANKDGTDPSSNNSGFREDSSNPDHVEVVLVATRHISANTELFVSYGASYWQRQGGKRKKKRARRDTRRSFFKRPKRKRPRTQKVSADE
jgi:hypothetical protein